MTDLAKLVVKLEADTAKYQRELDKANKKLDRFGSHAKKSVDGIKAAFAGLAIGATIKKITQATAKQEKALAQLEQGLRSTGEAAGFTKDELASYAAELQNATTFGDEDIIEAQANLLTFTKIAGEQFNRTTEAALNLSTRVGQDLKSSVIQLGKALNDPVANLGALGRTGIQFSDDQKDLIKTLAKTGQLAEAQTIILDELETQYGGSARAARDTFGGALEGLQNAFGDLLESSGGLDDNQQAIEELTSTLQDPAVVSAANTLTSSLIKGFSLVAKAIAGALKPLRLAGVTISYLTEGAQNLAGSIADFLSILPGGAGDAMESFKLSMDSAAESTRMWREEVFAAIAASDQLKNSASNSPAPALPPPASTPGISPATDFGVSAKKGELEGIINSLKTEEELLAQSYERQRAIVLDATSLTYQEKNKIISELSRQYEESLAEIRDREINSVIDSLKTQEERIAESYNRQREIILTATKLTAEQRKELMVRLNDEALQEIELSTKAAEGKIKDIYIEPKDSKTKTAFDKFFGENALQSLFSDFDNIEQRFKELLLRMAAEALAAGISNAIVGGVSSGAGGGYGAIATGVMSLFGGARADGGPVASGKAYLVGERGPELFLPKTGGDIVPNHGMAGTTNVSINLPNIRDTDTFRRSQGQIATEMAREIRRAGRNF